MTCGKGKEERQLHGMPSTKTTAENKDIHNSP